jgi:hypothetical protein
MTERILKIVLLVALSFMCVSISVLALQLRQSTRVIEKQSVESIQHINQLVVELQKDSKDIKEMTNATMFQISDAAHVFADTGRKQSKYWDELGRESVRTLENTNKVLEDLDKTTRNLDASSGQALVDLSASLQESRRTLEAATAAINSTNNIIQDKNITNILQSMNSSMVHVDSSLANVDKAVARMTKPQSLLKALVSKALGMAAQVATILK